MQLHASNIATAAFVICATFILWTGLQYLSNDEGTYYRVPSQAPSRIARPREKPQGVMKLDNERVNHAKLIAPPTLPALASPASPSPAGSRFHPPLTSNANHQQETGFAYAFFATSDAYACSALVNIHRLQTTLNTTLPIHILVSPDVSDPYLHAFNTLSVTVHLETTPPLKTNLTTGYYQSCLLKLLAFKLHLLSPHLTRILALDADQLLLQNLDHLFTNLPLVDLAAPRAYWLAKDFLASTFLLINLSDRLWLTVQKALNTIGYNKFDMDLVNDLLGDTVLMLGGEYVTLNSHWEDWNLPGWYHPVAELNFTTIDMINAASPGGRGGGSSGLGRRQNPGPRDMSPAVPIPGTQGIPDTPIPPVAPPLPGPHSLLPPLPDSPSVPVPAPQFPRFPPTHPLTTELHRLQASAAVIHFTAQGKPWSRTAEAVRAARPDAHPSLAAQFQAWREIAEGVCPGGIPGG